MVLGLGTREFSECRVPSDFRNIVFISHENRDDGWSENKITTQIFNSNKKISDRVAQSV